MNGASSYDNSRGFARHQDSRVPLFPAFGADGHRLVDRVELWKLAADDFLRRLNLSVSERPK
jgi:hypothetical protein